MKKRISIMIPVLLMTTHLSTAAFAETKEELKTRVITLEERIVALENIVHKIAAQKVTETKTASMVSKSVSNPKAVVFKTSDPAPTLKSEDGSAEFNLRGRMFLDWSLGSDQAKSFDYSGTKLRAAWFGIEGKATKNIKYKFEADFGSNKVSVKDAYLQFKSNGWAYTVGQSKIPNSLEWNTAISQTSLMERGAFKSAFGFGRGMGVKASTGGKNWGFTAGIFQGNNKFSGGVVKEGWTAAARVNYGQKSNDGTWVVGLSGRIRDTNGSGLSYKAKAITNQSGTMVSASGFDKDHLIAAEAAFSYGSLFGAAEYAFTSAKSGSETTNFSGGYVEVGYIFTGESRPLNIKKGAWGRPKVASSFKDGGSGLWQITARYDRLDLNNDGIYGGQQNNYVVSVSWYLTRYIRAMLDYGHTTVSDKGFIGYTNDADVVGVRLNVDW